MGGPYGKLARRRYVHDWLAANAPFRRYVLRELRMKGPLRARDLEDRVADGWRTGGWNDEGRSVAMMLDLLWEQGEVMIVGRDGQQRLWDLGVAQPADGRAASARSARSRWRSWNGSSARAVWAPRRSSDSRSMGGPTGGNGRSQTLVRNGVAVPVPIEGIDKGAWFAHADVLSMPWRPRTVALSPFDDLVSDRDHTEALFDFFFRLEIYVPKVETSLGLLRVADPARRPLDRSHRPSVRSDDAGAARQRRPRGGTRDQSRRRRRDGEGDRRTRQRGWARPT